MLTTIQLFTLWDLLSAFDRNKSINLLVEVYFLPFGRLDAKQSKVSITEVIIDDASDIFSLLN